MGVRMLRLLLSIVPFPSLHILLDPPTTFLCGTKGRLLGQQIGSNGHKALETYISSSIDLRREGHHFLQGLDGEMDEAGAPLV